MEHGGRQTRTSQPLNPNTYCDKATKVGDIILEGLYLKVARSFEGTSTLCLSHRPISELIFLPEPHPNHECVSHQNDPLCVIQLRSKISRFRATPAVAVVSLSITKTFLVSNKHDQMTVAFVTSPPDLKQAASRIGKLCPVCSRRPNSSPCVMSGASISPASMPPSRDERHSSVRVAEHSSESSNFVDIGDVLATAAAAAAHACQLIREVHDSRGKGVGLAASYKDLSDPRSALTVADQRAQAAIVGALRRDFPGIDVIAEEDQIDAPLAAEVVDGNKKAIQRVPLTTPESLRRVPLSDVCVFVDPVDATFQFVNENLTAVQTLVGISCRGRAVAGAIGLPFHDNAPVVCGIVGAGVVNLPTTYEPSRPIDLKWPGVVLTSSQVLKEAPLQAMRQLIDPVAFVPRAGAGNKIMAVAAGAADVTVLNMISSLWDTCAPEAILTALGGKLTDLFGNSIRYGTDARINNSYGVIATSAQFSDRDTQKRTHAELCAQLRRAAVADTLLANVGLVPSYPGEIQATDVARHVNGDIITSSWLSHILGCNVQSYSAPEVSSVRYLMSDAVRLELKVAPGTDSVDCNPEKPPYPRTLFYKRIVMRDLEHVKHKLKTAPQKIKRDVSSYQVEMAFLSSKACTRLRDAGIHIVRAYHLECQPAKEGQSLLSSCFSSLMEDYNPNDGWYQNGMLNGDELRSTLDALANLHGFFWKFEDDPEYDDLRNTVWNVGSYWAPERQAANQFETLQANWDLHLGNFRSSLREANVVGTDCVRLNDIGALLSKVAPEIANKMHNSFADTSNPYRTVIHGDAKAANFFYKRNAESQSASHGSTRLDVGMIDFQWTGFGCPATDVAYLICTSAAISHLSHDGKKEEELVEYYHESLLRSLVRFGKAADRTTARTMLPFATLKSLYEEALLDVARLAFSYHWVRISASPEVLESRKNILGSNSYNKSVPHAVWLIARTANLLDARLSPAAGSRA